MLRGRRTPRPVCVRCRGRVCRGWGRAGDESACPYFWAGYNRAARLNGTRRRPSRRHRPARPAFRPTGRPAVRPARPDPPMLAGGFMRLPPSALGLLLALAWLGVTPRAPAASPPLPQSLRIEPSAVELNAAGRQQQALVTGRAADGTEVDLTHACELTTDKPEVARVAGS